MSNFQEWIIANYFSSSLQTSLMLKTYTHTNIFCFREENGSRSIKSVLEAQFFLLGCLPHQIGGWCKLSESWQPRAWVSRWPKAITLSVAGPPSAGGSLLKVRGGRLLACSPQCGSQALLLAQGDNYPSHLHTILFW